MENNGNTSYLWGVDYPIDGTVDVTNIKVVSFPSPDAQIDALHDIIEHQNQYTSAIVHHITDSSTNVNEAITDIFTRKQMLQDLVDAYYDTYGVLLGIEL